jgi:hypothetical protein
MEITVESTNLITLMEPVAAPASAVVAAEVASFDYSTMPADDARIVQAAAARVRSLHREVTKSIIEAGRELTAVKARLPHGSWEAWLQAEFSWDPRTARNYIMLADGVGEKTETVSVLPASTAYKLFAKSTPAPVRAVILERLESGERIAPKAIEEIIVDGKAAAKEAARVAAQSPAERKEEASKKRRAKVTAQTRQARQSAQWLADRAIVSFKRLGAHKAVAHLQSNMTPEAFAEFVAIKPDTTHLSHELGWSSPYSSLPEVNIRLATIALKSIMPGGGTKPLNAHIVSIAENKMRSEPPIVVKPVQGMAGHGRFEILDGRQRFEVARELGWTEIDCIVVEG